MTSHTILNLNACRLHDRVDEALICMGDKYIMASSFMVGTMPKMKDYKKLIRLNRILNTDSCHINCNKDIIMEHLNITLNLYK